MGLTWIDLQQLQVPMHLQVEWYGTTLCFPQAITVGLGLPIVKRRTGKGSKFVTRLINGMGYKYNDSIQLKGPDAYLIAKNFEGYHKFSNE